MEDNNPREQKKNIMVRTPIGTRDFLPEDMILRDYVTGIIRKVFVGTWVV